MLALPWAPCRQAGCRNAQYPCWVWMHCGATGSWRPACSSGACTQHWRGRRLVRDRGWGWLSCAWRLEIKRSLLLTACHSCTCLRWRGRLFKATKGTPSVGRARKKWDVWLSAENWPAKRKILKEMEVGVNKKLVPNLRLKDLCRVWEHDSLSQSQGQSHSR